MCRSSQFSPRCPTCTRYVTSGSSPRAISRSSRCAVDAAVPAAAVAPVPGVPLFPIAARVGVHHTRTAREQSLAVFRVSRAPLVCGCILLLTVRPSCCCSCLECAACGPPTGCQPSKEGCHRGCPIVWYPAPGSIDVRCVFSPSLRRYCTV